MTPSPSRYGEGYCTISIATLSPGRAPLAPGSPTEIGSLNVVPSTLTKLGVAGLEVRADENSGGPRQDFDNPSLGARPAAPRRTGDLDGDFVAARSVVAWLRAGCTPGRSRGRHGEGERTRILWPSG